MFVCLLVGWLLHSRSGLAGPLLDSFVGGLAGLMGQFVGLVASRLVACLVGCFVGWLVGWVMRALTAKTDPVAGKSDLSAH